MNRTSKANRRGKCPACGAEISPGDRLILWPGGGGWVHMGCGSGHAAAKERERLNWERPGWQRRGLDGGGRYSHLSGMVNRPPESRTIPIGPAPPHPRTLLPSVQQARTEAQEEMARLIARERASIASQRAKAEAEPQRAPTLPPDQRSPQDGPPLSLEQRLAVDEMTALLSAEHARAARWVEDRMRGEGPPIRLPDYRESDKRRGRRK